MISVTFVNFDFKGAEHSVASCVEQQSRDCKNYKDSTPLATSFETNTKDKRRSINVTCSTDNPANPTVHHAAELGLKLGHICDSNSYLILDNTALRRRDQKTNTSDLCLPLSRPVNLASFEEKAQETCNTLQALPMRSLSKDYVI